MMGKAHQPYLPEKESAQKNMSSWSSNFLPFIPMENLASDFWRRARDGVCDDTDGVTNFGPIRVMQKSPMQI